MKRGIVKAVGTVAQPDGLCRMRAASEQMAQVRDRPLPMIAARLAMALLAAGLWTCSLPGPDFG